ncbi:MAG: alanine/ornithine racemase family PLP-dependent enzyme [Synergistaceae bacterium]|jgi:predicted amino acid racemase|nr:alanine/ornithine racemase family PLP-dependent enzyme [Synergistaceae bacterium]
MRCPALIVDRGKVTGNARAVAELCRSHGIDVWGVTKGLSGDPRLAEIYADAGFSGICDSRLRNLRKIADSGSPLPRQLMRIAMMSELKELAVTAETSLQSDIGTIKELDRICVSAGIRHKVLMMIDAGDLREGFWPTELPDAARELKDLEGGVKIVGVAANFACASGVLPTRDNMARLVECRDAISGITGREMPVVSVGGTCCLKMIEAGLAPEGVNVLRICEGVLLGTDTASDRVIPYLARDALTLTAEIVECRQKPSVPVGDVGYRAFGEKPVFTDRGLRKRAILAIGRQDVNIDRITPLDENVEIVTASSDHLIVDVTEAGATYRAGDTMSFRPLYPAMLACATSEYVEVIFE